ncbi:hypothetical protein [Salinifilum aidingensis]
MVRKAVARLKRARVSTWVLLTAVVLLSGGLLLSVPWSAVAAWSVDLLRAWGSAGPITLAGALLLPAVAIPRAVTRARRQNRAAGRQASVRPIPMWGIWLGAVVVVLVGVFAAAVLMVVFGSGTAEDQIRLEVIKLAGTIALGAGGGGALLLTARRRRAKSRPVVMSSLPAFGAGHFEGAVDRAVGFRTAGDDGVQDAVVDEVPHVFCMNQVVISNRDDLRGGKVGPLGDAETVGTDECLVLLTAPPQGPGQRSVAVTPRSHSMP